MKKLFIIFAGALPLISFCPEAHSQIIAGGWDYSLVVCSDSIAWAWGRNDGGTLGNGTNTSSNVPVQVSSLAGITSVAAGGGHSLALKNDGTVWAWGTNFAGALGNGTNTDSNIPVQVNSVTGMFRLQ